MRSLVLKTLLFVFAVAPLPAQTLSQAIYKLYSFGSSPGCVEQICLGGALDTIHRDHFNPAAKGQEGVMTTFLQQAIGASASNIPIAAATSTGILVQSGEGLPTRVATSGGPIFAERMQTIGKGGLYVGFNATNFNYSSLRGVPLTGLHTSITHQNVPPVDSINGGPTLGRPAFENDVIEVATSMRVNMLALTTTMTYGLFERVDVGVAIPVLSTSLSGTSNAQIMPFGINDPHYFGDSATRSLTTSSTVNASATGVGDIAARVKVGLHTDKKWGAAVLADFRFPTGNQENFQGTGSFSAQAIGIVSAQFEQFSPHANVGYFYKASSSLNDDILATVGFDQQLAEWATLAVDVISQWQVGPATFTLPPNVTLTSFNNAGVPNTTRTIVPSNIPDKRDDVVVGSFGLKFLLHSGVTLVTNALVPMMHGGLQPNAAFTLGMDYTF